MLEHHLNSPVTRQRLRSGPAADHIDGFADWLHRHGYRPVTIDTTLRSLAGWTDWMLAAGLTAQDGLEGVASCAAELQAHRRVRHCRGPNDHSLTAAALFVRFHREQAVLPPLAAPMHMIRKVQLRTTAKLRPAQQFARSINRSPSFRWHSAAPEICDRTHILDLTVLQRRRPDRSEPSLPTSMNATKCRTTVSTSGAKPLAVGSTATPTLSRTEIF